MDTIEFNFVDLNWVISYSRFCQCHSSVRLLLEKLIRVYVVACIYLFSLSLFYLYRKKYPNSRGNKRYPRFSKISTPLHSFVTLLPRECHVFS